MLHLSYEALLRGCGLNDTKSSDRCSPESSSHSANISRHRRASSEGDPGTGLTVCTVSLESGRHELRETDDLVDVLKLNRNGHSYRDIRWRNFLNVAHHPHALFKFDHGAYERYLVVEPLRQGPVHNRVAIDNALTGNDRPGSTGRLALRTPRARVKPK